MTFRITLAVGCAALLLAGCISSPTVPQCREVPFQRTGQSGDTISTATGLRFIETQAGEGIVVRSCRTVAVHYTLFLLDGTLIDSSHDLSSPLIFVPGLGDLIDGFEQGVMEMQVGGERRVIVPPALGYGNVQRGEIPPNSTLIFDIELLDAQG